MQPYALAKALVDSGKMLALDHMLSTLKGEGHRVLLFCQVRVLEFGFRVKVECKGG